METQYNDGLGSNYSSDSTIKRLEIQTNHEQVKQKEEYAHEERMEQIKNESKDKDEQRKHQKEMGCQALGWFGQLFGSKENSSRNITGAICLSFTIGATLVSLIVFFCKDDTEFVKGMWEIICPIITLSLGYLFGKK